MYCIVLIILEYESHSTQFFLQLFSLIFIQRKMSRQEFAKKCIKVRAVLGLLYHIYKELSSLSKFDNVISTGMKEESPIGLPSLTICINKEEILSKEKLEKIYYSAKN